MITTGPLVESRYAWARLWAALALMTIGGSGMYAVTVVLPLVQADFGISRSDASLPFAFTMIGFGLGGGFTYEPYGGRPGSQEDDCNTGGVGVADYFRLTAVGGPFQVGVEGVTNTGHCGVSGCASVRPRA